ncbi:MAG: imidazole glycerol phosphate synthase subunit HisH [Bacteroidales bacterium]|nr:imidazole glycerol phosphate synthase subunit HisH [Bacteroidales bacterium]
MQVVIIKYNAGNIGSVQHALRRLGVQGMVTDDPQQIRYADRVIFPGVGEAVTAMKYLKDKGLDQLIGSLNQPVLGICLGMQLMCRHSDEGATTGTGIFDTAVKRFRIDEKVPHTGWNQVIIGDSPLFDGLTTEPYLYFVHSYYARICRHTVAETVYGIRFSAALQRDNFFATQFHPEKSGRVGRQILKNFLSL